MQLLALISEQAFKLQPIFSTFTPFILLIISVILIYLFKSQFRIIAGCFSGLKKRTWIILVIIFIIALFLRATLPVFTHRLWTDESVFLLQAKEYLFSNPGIPVHDRQAGWPFMTFILFGLTGLNNINAIWFSVLIGAVSAVALFFLAYLITKKEELSLLAAFVFSIMPSHILHSASAGHYVPSVFFFILSISCFFVYYAKKTDGLFCLSIMLATFSSYIRPENPLLFPLFFLGILLFDKKLLRNIAGAKSITILVICAILVGPALLNVLGTYGSQNFARAFQQETGANVSNNELNSGAISISNFVSNSKVYGIYLFNNTFQPLLFSVLFIIGIFFGLATDKKKSLFLLIWFATLWIIFFISGFQYNGMNADVYAKDRFFIFFYPIMAIFMIYGINAIMSLSSGTIGKFQFSQFIAIVLAIIVVLLFIPYTMHFNSYENGLAIETFVIEQAEADIPLSCTIFSTLPEILLSTTHLSVLSTEQFLDSPQSFLNTKGNVSQYGCLLFFDDVYSRTGTNKWKRDALLASYTTTPFLTYSKMSFSSTRRIAGDSPVNFLNISGKKNLSNNSQQ